MPVSQEKNVGTKESFVFLAYETQLYAFKERYSGYKSTVVQKHKNMRHKSMENTKIPI